MDGELALQYFLEKFSARGITAPQPVHPKPDRSELRSKELELWKTWKDSGHKPEHLDPLIKSFAGIIQGRVNKYRTAEVPIAAVEHEVKKEFVKALKEFDPSKGTTLATYVTGNIQKSGRYVDNNKNFARVSSNVGEKLGYFNSMKSQLTEKLGYPPSAQEIHDHLIVSPHEKLGRLSMDKIIRYNKDQRRGLISSANDPTDLSGKMTSLTGADAREEEVIRLIYPQLTNEEKSVYEYIYGVNGKPALKRGEIAKKMGWDGPKVSKVVASIRKKVLGYL